MVQLETKILELVSQGAEVCLHLDKYEIALVVSLNRGTPM